MISPEALAGEFFSLTGYDKHQLKAFHDQELTAGQFWRMIEKKKNSVEGEIEFVADSTGNVFRKFKGYEVRGKRKESMADAKMVNEFFEMVDQQHKNTESSAEIYGGDLWRMINESKNHVGEIQFTADKNGNIFKNVKGYQMSMKAKPREPAVEAEWVRQFFTMVERQQQNDEAKVESYAGNFWKMINNSTAETERKVKREAFAGDFWKMVEFSENLRRKRETMRRLSESNREAASTSASASASTSASAPFVATPAKAGVDNKEGARRTALLFACSTLEEQAVFLLAPEYQQTHGQGGRKRKTSSSSSLYSVNEEEEFRAEVSSTSAPTASASSSASTPRRLFRVTPHYGQSQQLGAPKGSEAAPKSGVIVVALRSQKRTSNR